MRLAVLADTHAPRRWKGCPPSVADELRAADVILHAGDVCTADVLDELATFAPVHAVQGNNDGPDVWKWGARETFEAVFGGVSVAMIHDSGTAKGRLERLRGQFRNADLVVFGHSHIPLDLVGGGFRALNPGSPTDRRRQPYGTMAVVQIDHSRISGVRIIRVT